MLERNQDYRYIITTFPGYIDKLEQFSRDVYRKFDCYLGVELKDSAYYDALKFWIEKDGIRLSDDQMESDIQNSLKQFEAVLNETCGHCGSNFNVKSQWCEVCTANKNREELRLSTSAFAHFTRSSFFKSNPGDNDLYARKKIRFINSFERFDYANFGSYFFYGKELFIITDRKFYEKLDIKDNFRETIFYNHVGPSSFVIKGLYAGQDTGFHDDKNERIYTGDIIKMKGARTEERDPHKYFGKDRYVAKEGQSIYEVYGVVSSYDFCWEAYQVVLDNHGAFLCHATELEILGNIFYDLVPEERVNIWRKACQIAQSGYALNGFWRIHTRETIKEDLKIIKTPGFMMISNIR
jgi:hypothetical protein